MSEAAFVEHPEVVSSTIACSARKPGRAASVWDNPEVVRRLTELWASGLSASAIGKTLSLSKNAVLGKVHRLGLPGRSSSAQEERIPQPPRATSARSGKVPGHRTQAVAARPERTLAKTSLDAEMRTDVVLTTPRLRPLGCRWPMWSDEAKPTHEYCGKPVVAVWPHVYCPECVLKMVSASRRPLVMRALGIAVPSSDKDV